MVAFLSGQGFLHTKAQIGADVSLAIVLVAAVLFTYGWRLAARGRYEAHRRVMTTGVLLDAAVVLTWMIRSFVLYVAPEIPGKLDQRAYAVNTVHAAIGVVGMALGVFVVLRGSELVPSALKFSDYKPWMRSAYAVYMLATLAGVAVYLVAYVDHLR